MEPSEVTAVVVTRGDVPLTEILESLRDASFDEILVWINGDGLVRYRPADDSTERVCDAPDLSVYGRYAAIKYAWNEFIYAQDDDCLIPVPELFEAMQHVTTKGDYSTAIVANMLESRWSDYPDSCLVGWGSIFHRDLPDAAFALFDRKYGFSGLSGRTVEEIESFQRVCDVVFTTLTPHVKVDVGFQHLPWAEDPDRAMFLQPQHRPERERAYELARAAR